MAFKSRIDREDFSFESVTINKAKGMINFKLAIIEFIDKDTKQKILYLPSFDVTGYGETKEKALSMLDDCVNDFCDYLLKLPMGKIKKELIGLGWKANKLFNKQFSKASVGIDGVLNNFNVEESSVKFSMIEAA